VTTTAATRRACAAGVASLPRVLMVDIYHDFRSTWARASLHCGQYSHGLDAWWTNRATGTAARGGVLRLCGSGRQYD
jgi:hypothetical protein